MGKVGSALASRKRGAPCAEDVEVSLPPLSELEAITDMVEFRKKAKDLGMVVRVLKPVGSRWVHRTKAATLGDYKRKLDQPQAASATSELAAKSFFGFCFGGSSSDGSRIDARHCQRWFGFVALRS